MVERNVAFISLCCQRCLEVFDANLKQSNTHNYTCLTVRVKATVQSLLSIISHITKIS